MFCQKEEKVKEIEVSFDTSMKEKEFEKYMNDLDRYCPICGFTYSWLCQRCIEGERGCINDHSWLICKKHKHKFIANSYSRGSPSGQLENSHCHSGSISCDGCHSGSISCDDSCILHIKEIPNIVILTGSRGDRSFLPPQSITRKREKYISNQSF